MKNIFRSAVAGIALLLATAALAGNDPVLEWNSIMLGATATRNPSFQARFARIMQLAVFEAANAIDPRATRDYAELRRLGGVDSQHGDRRCPGSGVRTAAANVTN